MKSTLYIVIILFVVLNNLQAQETITTSGGEASGSGGTISYSIGQTFYSTTQGINGNTIAQGVQQPYEISVVIGIQEAKDISLSVMLYPNPSTDYLIIKVDNYETTHLKYLLFDSNGKLLKTINQTGKETKIETYNLATASYFIKIVDREKEVKVFKIIKK